MRAELAPDQPAGRDHRLPTQRRVTLPPGAYHETDAGSCTLNFAFVEVDAEDLGRVSLAVKGHPAFPKGFTTPANTLTGDQIQLSGYGLGYDTTPATQEQRKAIMGFDDTETYTVSGPIHRGDSGGPLVHAGTGRALGIVSRLCAGSFTVTLRTV